MPNERATELATLAAIARGLSLQVAELERHIVALRARIDDEWPRRLTGAGASTVPVTTQPDRQNP